MQYKILIPARGVSKRIPNKNMIDVNGTPLISYVIEECKKLTDSVYVSSDSADILNYSIALGVNAITRPADLSTDFSKTEDVVKHFLSETNTIGIFIVVQPTSPLLKAEYIQEGIEMLSKFDSIISVVEETPFYWSKGVPVNFSLGTRGRTQDRDPWYRENGAFYITTASNFKNGMVLQNGSVGHIVMDKYDSIDVDNLDDLKVIRRLIK